MRLPRIRIRHMMIAVALIGSAVWIFVRHDRFRWIAATHRGSVPMRLPPIKPSGMDDRRWRLLEWHQSMARKYERAARYPWLPVEADSLPPE
jgi:hypothetical protein